MILFSLQIIKIHVLYTLIYWGDNMKLQEIKEKLKKMEQTFLYSRYEKYIVDYKEDGKYLIIISNLGKKRKVYNTLENKEKIEDVINKNRLLIENKINNYEETIDDRKKVFFINLVIIAFSGISVPLAFFTGIYIFFLLSIAIFCLITFIGIISGVEMYVNSKEVKDLKNKVGYEVLEEPLCNIKYDTINKVSKMLNNIEK